jgi:hypothetical protein
MARPLSDTPEQIREVAEAEAVGTELTKKNIDEIVEVSASAEEAANRVRAVVEGRIGEEDDPTTGEDASEVQAPEVERADQGDREMQAAKLAQVEGEDPGKAVKQAKKDAIKEGRGDTVSNA